MKTVRISTALNEQGPKEQQSIGKPNSYYRKTISVIVILSFINKGDLYLYCHFNVSFFFMFYSRGEIPIVHDNYNPILQT